MTLRRKHVEKSGKSTRCGGNPNLFHRFSIHPPPCPAFLLGAKSRSKHAGRRSAAIHQSHLLIYLQ